MKLLRVMCVAGLASVLLLLGACGLVGSRHIVGRQLTEDVSDSFGGVWRMDDDLIFVRQCKPGELRCADVCWDEETKSFVVKNYSLLLSELDGEHYANFVLADSDGVTHMHLFARYRIENNVMLLWFPEYDAFEVAVRNKVLEGRAEDGNTWIEGDAVALNDFIEKHAVAELFALDKPEVAIRVVEE